MKVTDMVTIERLRLIEEMCRRCEEAEAGTAFSPVVGRLFMQALCQEILQQHAKLQALEQRLDALDTPAGLGYIAAGRPERE